MHIDTDAERTGASIPEKLDYILDRLQVLDKKIDPIVEAYDSVLLSKKFIVGIAGFVTAVVALGAGIIWTATFIRHYLKF